MIFRKKWTDWQHVYFYQFGFTNYQLLAKINKKTGEIKHKKIEICMTGHNVAEDLEKNYKEMKDRL